VRDVGETVRSVMVIGHNPGMHEFGVSLAGRSSLSDAANRLLAGFPTGALAEFAIASPWRQLSAGGGQLVRFLTPRDLRDGEAVETPD
jgi:phosphohistidine phosphatase